MPQLDTPEQSSEPGRDALRAQILSTEHWSLLASRNLVWSESFSRATWFVTVVSATVVALALVGERANSGIGFRLFALVLIPLLVIIGVATVIRLVQLNGEDVMLVVGMNRLRRGYLDLAPELERYFVTGSSDDFAGVMRTYGATRTRIPSMQYASSIPLLVSVIVAVLVGALAGVVADSFGVRTGLAVGIGIGALVIILGALLWAVVSNVRNAWNRPQPGVPAENAVHGTSPTSESIRSTGPSGSA